MMCEKLLYWKSGDGIRLSKTKLICLVIFFSVVGGRIYYTHDFGTALAVASITTIAAFIIGLVIHNSIKNDSAGSYGLKNDLKHLFFYWQEGGEFVLSKTKIITALVFLVSVIFYCILNGLGELGSNIFVSLFIAAPVFLIGYFTHTNKNSSEKAVEITLPANKKVSDNPRHFNKYNAQITLLKKEFCAKDKKARHLVEKTFEPPQLTYDRFIIYLERCEKLFDEQMSVIETISNLAGEGSPKLEREIEKRINISKSIIDKIDLLNSELAIHIAKSKSSDSDIDNLFEESESLIDSLKDYDLNLGK